MSYSSAQVKQSRSAALGFDACRILPVGEAPHADFFDAWLDHGRAGEMDYLRNAPRPSAATRRCWPTTRRPVRAR